MNSSAQLGKVDLFIEHSPPLARPSTRLASVVNLSMHLSLGQTKFPSSKEYPLLLPVLTVLSSEEVPPTVVFREEEPYHFCDLALENKTPFESLWQRFCSKRAYHLPHFDNMNTTSSLPDHRRVKMAIQNWLQCKDPRASSFLSLLLTPYRANRHSIQSDQDSKNCQTTHPSSFFEDTQEGHKFQ